MAQHTEGPWTAHWSKYREETFVVQAGMPSNRVLASFDGDGDGPDDEDLANARLIAASPDLFDALIDVTERFEAALEATHATKTDRLVIKAARAALAKAKGLK